VSFFEIRDVRVNTTPDLFWLHLRQQAEGQPYKDVGSGSVELEMGMFKGEATGVKGWSRGLNEEL
jgi:hypothetical protein